MTNLEHCVNQKKKNLIYNTHLFFQKYFVGEPFESFSNALRTECQKTLIGELEN